MMKHLQKICLSCQFFRPKSTEDGLCRLDKGKFPDYPVMAHTDTCPAWKTSGQQYYIRVGWLKKQLEQSAEPGSAA
jgi:hypothetical protein